MPATHYPSGSIARRWIPSLCLFLILAGCAGGTATSQQTPAPKSFRILVFSKTAGFRHASIEPGIAAIQALGARNGFSVDASEDAAVFAPDNLAKYDAVVFLSTTGDILDATQQAAFEGYIRGGGGFVGIHAAADTEYDWAWYGELVGGYFKHHPPGVHQADVQVLDRHFPATAGLPARWSRTDEWYDYKANPRGKVHVLATLNETSYEGGQMGADHPISWAHVYDGGRAFYTGLGHTDASYSAPLYLQHILGGIRWAAGQAEGDAAATMAGAFEKVVLDEDTTYPMELDIAQDGRVFFIERDGALKVWDPETERTTMAAYIPVTTKIEDGLLGLALDPNFATNQWLYLYYAPLDEKPNRLSRFTMKGNELDMTSEIVMLEVPVQRLRCCHSAGSIQFGPDNNLYLSTGENGGGWNATGEYTPGLYEWDAYWDNERSTANTNDLRGKILRIHPEPDGSYTIPAGNLFEDDDLRTRPEIFTMGHRNPFRFDVDAETGWIYWGDVGPGNQPNPDNAPTGYEEINQARKPGFFGWPQFVGPNLPYRDRDPATREYTTWADPAHPVNDSPNNTGIRNLPPAQPAFIWYFYTPEDRFPELGAGGMSAAAGPIYHYDAKTVSPRGLPAYYDKSVFIYDFMRNWIMEAKLDEQGDLMEINPLFSDLEFIRPIDLEQGPDGRLYALEWGTEFWGQNRNGKLVRLDYYGDEPHAQPTMKQPAPQASLIQEPRDGSFFDYGHPIPYRVAGAAGVQPYLGHDTHTHRLKPVHGETGEVTVVPDLSHWPYIIDEFVELEAAPLDPSQGSPHRIRLHPRRWQAENYTDAEGAQLVVTNNRQRPTFVDETEVFLEMKSDAYAMFGRADLQGIASVALRVVPEATGSVELRLDAPDGLLLGRAALTPAPKVEDKTTGDPPPGEGAPRFRIVRIEGWTEVDVPIQAPPGAHDVYVVFRGPAGDVAKFDWVAFRASGAGSSTDAP
ncbi:MAG: ThuA domain-containing protein [Rhodothermales bacterium]